MKRKHPTRQVWSDGAGTLVALMALCFGVETRLDALYFTSSTLSTVGYATSTQAANWPEQ